MSKRNYTHMLTVVVVDDTIRNGNGKRVDDDVQRPAASTIAWAFNPNRLYVRL